MPFARVNKNALIKIKSEKALSFQSTPTLTNTVKCNGNTIPTSSACAECQSLHADAKLSKKLGLSTACQASEAYNNCVASKCQSTPSDGSVKPTMM